MVTEQAVWAVVEPVQDGIAPAAIERRARELRAEKVRRLGRLVRVLRLRRGQSRIDVAQQLGDGALPWLTLLEQELLTFGDVSRAQLRALAQALDVGPEWLAASCGFLSRDGVHDM